MKKLIWTLVILVVVGVFGGRAWYLHKQSVAEKDVVKIGVLVPLTGPTARDGADSLSGMKIAINEINQNPEFGFKLDLLVEDNKLSAPPSLSAFHKINGQVSAFIVAGTPPILTLLPVLNKPALSMLNSEDEAVYTSTEVFRAWFRVKEQAEFISNYVKNNYKDSRIAFLKIKAIEGDTFEKILKMKLKDIGQELVANETFGIGDLETKNQVVKILDKKPDIIVVYGYAQGYVAALNSLLEQGYKGTIITNHDVQMNHKHIANNASGIYFGTADYDFTKIAKNNPDLADNLFAAFGYESVKILANVIRENGKDSKKIHDGLINLRDFKTDFGNISYDEKGEMHTLKFVIKQMQPDGTAKVIKE